MDIKRKIKKYALLIVNAALAAAALCCLLLAASLPDRLVSQNEAQRWQGDGDEKFAQTTVFIPNDEKMSLDELYALRGKLSDKLHEAALDIERKTGLITDAWCTKGRVSVYSGYGKGEAAVMAVGGSFFDFHPIPLINGSYIRESDLMKDRVLLDEELAWLLFGGTDLQGMSVSINNENFYVAGVIAREDDFATRRAYADGMGLFMSYDAYCALDETAGITCYELVMPQPVKNYAYTTVSELCKDSGKQVVDNTGRFTAGALVKTAGNLAVRTIQSAGIDYPYWENAARYMEFCCGALVLLALVLLVLPVVCSVVGVIRLASRGKRKLEDDVLPEAKDNVEEFFRKRGRKRWERREAKRRARYGLHSLENNKNENEE